MELLKERNRSFTIYVIKLDLNKSNNWKYNLRQTVNVSQYQLCPG
jgi:hypothetical protein